MPTATCLSSGISRRHFLLGGPSYFERKTGRGTLMLCGVEFTHLKNGNSTRRFLRIHGNEETARRALEKVLAAGQADAWIVTSTTRHVVIHGASIDPNRMFSRAGAARSLRALNPAPAAGQLEEILDFLDRERPRLLEVLTPPPGGLIVAVHNNGEGYSIDTEAPISQAVHRAPCASPHEFFLATDRDDYRRITQGPYNAVLQSEAGGGDDGSLSRWAAAHRIRYVNLEARHGRLDVQVEMLQWLLKTLP